MFMSNSSHISPARGDATYKGTVEKSSGFTASTKSAKTMNQQKYASAVARANEKRASLGKEYEEKKATIVARFTKHIAVFSQMLERGEISDSEFRINARELQDERMASMERLTCAYERNLSNVKVVVPKPVKRKAVSLPQSPAQSSRQSRQSLSDGETDVEKEAKFAQWAFIKSVSSVDYVQDVPNCTDAWNGPGLRDWVCPQPVQSVEVSEPMQSVEASKPKSRFTFTAQSDKELGAKPVQSVEVSEPVQSVRASKPKSRFTFTAQSDKELGAKPVQSVETSEPKSRFTFLSEDDMLVAKIKNQRKQDQHKQAQRSPAQFVGPPSDKHEQEREIQISFEKEHKLNFQLMMLHAQTTERELEHELAIQTMFEKKQNYMLMHDFKFEHVIDCQAQMKQWGMPYVPMSVLLSVCVFVPLDVLSSGPASVLLSIPVSDLLSVPVSGPLSSPVSDSLSVPVPVPLSVSVSVPVSAPDAELPTNVIDTGKKFTSIAFPYVQKLVDGVPKTVQKAMELPKVAPAKCVVSMPKSGNICKTCERITASKEYRFCTFCVLMHKSAEQAKGVCKTCNSETDSKDFSFCRSCVAEHKALRATKSAQPKSVCKECKGPCGADYEVCHPCKTSKASLVIRSEQAKGVCKECKGSCGADYEVCYSCNQASQSPCANANNIQYRDICTGTQNGSGDWCKPCAHAYRKLFNAPIGIVPPKIIPCTHYAIHEHGSDEDCAKIASFVNCALYVTDPRASHCDWCLADIETERAKASKAKQTERAKASKGK